MPRLTPFVLIALISILPAPAFAMTAHESFDRINQCVQKGDTTHCRSYFTKGSAAIYDRFVGYGLAKCLPLDAHYVEEKSLGNHMMVRATTQAMGSPRFMRFIFSQEKDDWKLDVPESLRTSMGDNWEQKLQAAEQLYAALRPQGGPVICPNLAPKTATPAATLPVP